MDLKGHFYVYRYSNTGEIIQEKRINQWNEMFWVTIRDSPLEERLYIESGNTQRGLIYYAVCTEMIKEEAGTNETKLGQNVP